MSVDAQEIGMSLMQTTTGVIIGTDGNAAKTILYTVPAGKRFIPLLVVLRDNSHSLVGCNDVDFGTGAACATQNFLNNETGIVDMTAVTDYMVLSAHGDEYTIVDGDAAAAVDREFGIYVVAGATEAGATVTIDVLGYLFDS